jgi:hypothetical protein
VHFTKPFELQVSPFNEQQELINENHNWVQTYSNTESHLRSNYTNMLAFDYISDVKTLLLFGWLRVLGSSATIFNQPYRKVSYGMLIDADSTKTGYNGADYDFYLESVGGKVSGYLYHLSSTGGYRLIGS